MNFHSLSAIAIAIAAASTTGAQAQPALSALNDHSHHGASGGAAPIKAVDVRGLPDAAALVQVDAPWIRAAVTGQSGTGGFMRLTAREPMKLVGVVTPSAGTSEVHEMKMDGDVMKMRAVASIDLPAGKTVELKPGGFHLMLMDLKAPLADGGVALLTLVLEDAKGARRKLDLKAAVALRSPSPLEGRKQ